MRALKLQQKASKVGFDWNDPRAVLDKIREETDEIEAALDSDGQRRGGRRDRRSDVRAGQSGAPSRRRCRRGLARHQCQVRTPLRAIEAALAKLGKTPSEATLAEMDALWDEAKAAESDEAPPLRTPSAVAAKRART